ncbi:MAG: hypothetical protein JWO71_688 [Candidatus Acidoferrum typicum]|jgi:AbiJ N-terminal domain 4|nr:hypothetical protein [Candidatus Acidoferrum typicum]
MTFSERQGFKPIRQVLQADSMDEALRSRLWNVLVNSFPSSKEGYKFSHPDSRNLLRFCERAWHEHFKRPIDTIPEWPNEAIKLIRSHFFQCNWYEVYDLMEFVEGIRSSFYSGSRAKEFNGVLAAELSAYRFVDGKLAPISSEQANWAIEQAIAQTSDSYSGTSEHLKQAVALLAQKPNPDYRNSIKESVSAVEAICGVITGNPKATLGQALKVIDSQAPLHSALRSAFEKLYGYTSDAEGIRHALFEENKLEQEDAVFMLVTCSAFVSYVIAKRARNIPGSA